MTSENHTAENHPDASATTTRNKNGSLTPTRNNNGSPTPTRNKSGSSTLARNSGDKQPQLARLVRLEEDYPMFLGWWETHGVLPPGPGILPACGILVEDGAGQGIIAAWVYQDNSSPVCFPGWFVSNPEKGPFEVAKGMQHLLGAIEVTMRNNRRNCIFAVTNTKSVGRLLVKRGYEIGHPATEYWKILEKE